MSKKLTAALVATLASLSLGVAYAAGDKAADKASTDGAPAADQSMQKAWSKDDAKKNGVSDAQFKAADTNADGKLDQTEIQAAGLQKKQ